MRFDSAGFLRQSLLLTGRVFGLFKFLYCHFSLGNAILPYKGGHMKKIALIVLVALSAKPAFASQCVRIPLSEEFKNAGAVFAAVVTKVHAAAAHETVVGLTQRRIITLDVQKVWKGSLLKTTRVYDWVLPTLSVSSIPWQEGELWLVFGRYQTAKFWNDGGSRITRFSDEEKIFMPGSCDTTGPFENLQAIEKYLQTKGP